MKKLSSSRSVSFAQPQDHRCTVYEDDDRSPKSLASKSSSTDEHRVVAFMEADGNATNGERYNQRYCQTFGFRDGLIAEVFEFFDSTLAQTALWDNRLTKPEMPPEQQFQF